MTGTCKAEHGSIDKNTLVDTYEKLFFVIKLSGSGSGGGMYGGPQSTCKSCFVEERLRCPVSCPCVGWMDDGASGPMMEPL